MGSRLECCYNDLERRRADNTESYSATGESCVYVQHGEARFGGLQGLLCESEEDRENLKGDYVKHLTRRLQNIDWYRWLPEGVDETTASREDCLAAVEYYYTANGSAVCLRDYGDGHLQLPGKRIGRISMTGEVPFSEDAVESAVDSWIGMVSDGHSTRYREGLAHAFRTTLCANTVHELSHVDGSTTRHVEPEDHESISNWAFCKRFRHSNAASLFHYPDSSNPMAPTIDNAIRSATVRRTFFITDNGYIGLGSPTMRHGDRLFVLLGGKTPLHST